MKFILKKLKNSRIENKLTVQKMAAKLYISKPFYSQLENGQRKLSYENAIKIANIFNTTPDELFYNDFKEMIRNKKKS